MSKTWNYDVLINVQFENGRIAKHGRYGGTPAYTDGDMLVKTWRGGVDIDPEKDLVDAAWELLIRHNRDDRPDGQVGPSFSEGDVLRLHTDNGWVCFASIDNNLVEVPNPYPSRIDKRTWIEVMDANRG